ncbi:MAG: MFS transporter [Anaerolineae bacterium]|nr:MFS transporter [Anaerolineae bacterium]
METHQVYGYRWINLAVASLSGFGMALAFIGPGALVDSVAKEWSVNFSQATLALVLLGGLFSGILGLPAGVASDKWGYKLPLVIGATIATVGLLLRGTASTWNLFLLYNAIAAVGSGFTMSGMGTLVRKWFPMDEIGQANGLSMIMGPVGAGVCMAIAFPLVDAVGWSNMWLILGLIYAVPTVLAWILLKENPPLPPAPLPEMAKRGVFHEARQVMSRTNMLLQLVIVAVIGLVTMAPALIPVAFAAKNIPDNTIGFVLALLNFVGLPAMALIPGWAFRKGLSKTSMAISMFAAGLSFIAIFYLPMTGGNILVAAAMAVVAGLALAAPIPIAMSIAMSQPGVHPGNVGILSGLMMTVMGLGRLVLPPIVGGFVDHVGPAAGAWVLTVVLVIAGFVLVGFVPEEKPVPHPAATGVKG